MPGSEATIPTPEQSSAATHVRALKLFELLIELDPADRSARLEQLAQEQPELANEVAELLDADVSEGLDQPWPSLATASGQLTAGPPGGAEGSAIRIGDRLGAYEVVRVLGSGGMGTVFEGRRVDGRFEQRVAIKALSIRAPAKHDEVVLRFVIEREVLSRLDHPGISRILDAGETDSGVPYLVMEHVAGTRLDRYCDDRELTVRQRVRLVIEICRAISYAHRNLVIHRDLKPANILVTDQGAPKLLDFGIAKLLEPRPGPALTRTGRGPLTPEYASPEQLLGEPVTTASDVYALGVVLYELLCGHRPFEQTAGSALQLERSIVERVPSPPSQMIASTTGAPGGPAEASGAETATRLLCRGLRSPGELRRELRGDLDRITLQAIHPDPERRYQSADQLAADLERYLAGLPVLARGDSWGYRARKFVQRHWLGVAAAAAVVIALAVGLGVATWQAQIATQQRTAAEQAALQSDQMNNFLVDLLAAPGGRFWRDLDVSGPETRVIDVLDAAGRRLETELPGAPLVRANLHQTLADTYLALRRGDAVHHARRALELRRAELGPIHPLVAESLYYLSAALLDPGERLATQLEGIEVEHVLDRPTNNYYYLLIEACETAARLGWFEPTEEWYAAAQNDTIERHGPHHWQVAYLHIYRAQVRAERGDIVGARADLLEVQSWVAGHDLAAPGVPPELRSHLARATLTTSWLAGDLGDALLQRDAMDPDSWPRRWEVELLYDLGELAASLELLDSERSPRRNDADFALRARLVLRLDGDADRCIELASEAVRLEEGWARGPSWYLAEAHSALGACWAAIGETERAREHLEPALAMLQKLFGDEGPLQSRAEAALAELAPENG